MSLQLGNYPCYQITAGYIKEEEYLLSYISPIHPSTIKNPKRQFHIDPVVGDHKNTGRKQIWSVYQL